MKVSASLYSGNPSKKVETLIELEDIGIDAIHLDCKDDPLVFEDFSTIRKNCSAIIDLHLITSNPEDILMLFKFINRIGSLYNMKILQILLILKKLDIQTVS